VKILKLELAKLDRVMEETLNSTISFLNAEKDFTLFWPSHLLEKSSVRDAVSSPLLSTAVLWTGTTYGLKKLSTL
jgi:hypothetical protein